MPPKCETPREGGVSRNSCGGSFRDNLTPHVLQAQFLMLAQNVRPELAVMLAAVVFGGGACNG
jgi:hypothetical protein